MTGITSAQYICVNDNHAKVRVIKSLGGQMGTKRSVRRLALFVVATIIPMIASFGAYASDIEDRAAALTGAIDWVRQAGDDKVVSQDMCARFLLICGTDGATNQTAGNLFCAGSERCSRAHRRHESGRQQGT